MFTYQTMNALKVWLDENGTLGRKGLLAELRKKYPSMSSVSIGQYAHGKRIPEKRKAEIIAGFIGVPLDSIPFRMVNQPIATTSAEKSAIPEDSGNGGGGKPKNKPLKSKGFFFFLRRALAREG